MKIIVLQENLARNLNLVGRVISSKSQLPILQNILISAQKGRIKLCATNLESSLSVWTGGKIEKEGEITVSAKLLTELVASLLPGKVTLYSQEDSLLKAESVGFKSSLNCLSAADFPPLASISGKAQINWPANLFVLVCSSVVFSASIDEARPVLNGVLIKNKANKEVELVATDGYRLSIKTVSLGKQNLQEQVILIPARALLEAGRITQEARENQGETKKEVGLSIFPDTSQAVFSWEDVELSTRLLDGQFPDYEKIIPQGFSTRIIFDKEELQRAVKIASVFARNTANIIKFKVQGSRLKVSANAPQVGEGECEISVEQEGEDNEIAFNYRYVLDFLNSTPSPKVEMQMTTPLNPAVFRPEKDNSYLHVIMPVRVQE